MPRDFDQEGLDFDIEVVEFVPEVICIESKVQRCTLGGFMLQTDISYIFMLMSCYHVTYGLMWS